MPIHARLSTRLPDGPANGLAGLDDDLAGYDELVLVAVVHPAKLETDLDSGRQTIVLAPKEIEIVPGGKDHQAAVRVLRRTRDARNGQQALDVDPDTGEISR